MNLKGDNGPSEKNGFVKPPHLSGVTARYNMPQDQIGASLVAQLVKKPPAAQETWVRSLSREDPLEEGMATHSNILARRIAWTEESGGLWSTGSQRVGHN